MSFSDGADLKALFLKLGAEEREIEHRLIRNNHERTGILIADDPSKSLEILQRVFWCELKVK